MTIIRSAVAAILALTASHSLSEIYFDPGSFVGTWTGIVSTFSPLGDDKTFLYRFEIRDRVTAFVLETEDADPTELGQCFEVRIDERRLHCTQIRTTAEWVELFDFDFIRLDEGRIYLYVTRTVDNSQLDPDHPERHFIYQFGGELLRNEPTTIKR